MSAEAADISQLSESQQAALQTYTSVTDQNPLEAIPLLQRSQWNVQIAITRFFEGEPTSDILAEAQAAIPPPTSRQTANLQYESLLAASSSPMREVPVDTVQRIDTAPATVPQYRPGLILSILLTPVNIFYRILNTVLSPFSFLIPQVVSRLFTNLLTTAHTSRRALPPAETATRFIREFNEQYPSSTPLPWSTSGFNLNLEDAKREQKFLLVVLLSPTHDDTQSYVRDSLQSPSFRSFLDSHSADVRLWGGNIQDNEAYQVSSNLSCTKFPFAALICQTPSSAQSNSATGGNMTVVSRLTGPMPATELVAKLSTAITSHQAALRTARAQQAERQASQSLRQEQDSAYERSLAQDRERTRKKREEEETRANAEKEALKRIEETETLKRRKEQWRIWRASQIHPEPPTETKDTIRVSIRMKDGQRIIRKFRADDSLEEVYAVVECHDLLENPEAIEGNRDEVKNYKHEYRFRLVSPMPRTVYELDQGGTVAARVGRGANLMVEEIEDEDDDEESN